MDNKKIPTWVGTVVLVIIAVTVGVLVWKYEKEVDITQTKNIENQPNKSLLALKQSSDTRSEIQTPADGTYKNTQYNFQIIIPNDWKIIENNDDNLSDPFFVFYKEIPNANDGKIISAGLFTEGTFVIVNPHGQGTEGLSGKTLPSDIKSSENTKVASDYILKNKSRWATFMNFKNNPKSWNESGFIFGKNIIQNEKKTCERNEVVINDNKCDLWNGDVIAYDGYTNDLDRKQVEKILSSFKFSNTEEVSFCGKNYSADKVILNNIDIIKSIATLSQKENSICKNMESGNFQESGIGIAQKEDNPNTIVLFNKDDIRESSDPFNQSPDIFRFDFNINKILYQSQFDGSFKILGNI